MEFIQIEQHILDKVNKDIENEKINARKKGGWTLNETRNDFII